MQWLKHWIDRVPYWYGSLDEVDRTSINAISFVLGISLFFGMIAPSWAHAQAIDCDLKEIPEFTEDQLTTIEVCADLAFKDSGGIYAESGPVVAFSFLSYRVGWCIYHEVHPNHSVHQFHDWLQCSNQSRGLEYFF